MNDEQDFGTITRPYALLTMEETNEVDLKLIQSHALADILNASCHETVNGPSHESLAQVSGMLLDHLGDIESLMGVGRERESAARQGAA
jgi:hypothetical protein